MRKRHTLLVVDDEPDLTKGVHDLFRRDLDFRVLGATGGPDGLRILEREEVHIVLSDQRMPEMSGVEFLRRVREAYPEVVRLLFTAYADIKAVIDAINKGSVYRYISKPWVPGELETIVRQAAEHYDLQAERRRLGEELRAKNQQLEKVNAELLKLLQKDKQLGNYQLLEELGHGGMGTVYKALHLLLMKVVALKVLPIDRMSNVEAVARFRREMKAVGRLNHPNIVQALDAGEVNGTHFLVMEFLEGAVLSRLIARRDPLPVPDACESVRQAALGLQHAHEHGLVHRDIKPSNLILTPAGQIKVLDLGLARLCDEASNSEELTGLSRAVGTADYMAPEQAFGTGLIDIRADVYSLGCTLYHLLAGRTPFSGLGHERAINKLMAHAHRPVPPIRGSRPEVSHELVQVLDRLLAKDPTERFATPAEVVAALQPFTAGADLPKLLLLMEPGYAGRAESGEKEDMARGLESPPIGLSRDKTTEEYLPGQ